MPRSAEDQTLVELALGRLFRIMSRPYKDGDDREYAVIRSIVMDVAGDPPSSGRPNYAADRRKGAQGD